MLQSRLIHLCLALVFLLCPVFLLSGIPIASGQAKKQVKAKGKKQLPKQKKQYEYRIDLVTIDGEPVSEGDEIEIEDCNIVVRFATEQVESTAHAKKVWCRNFAGNIPHANISDLPSGAPDKVEGQHTVMGALRIWETNEHATFQPAGQINNTLAIWALYEFDDHVRYYKKSFRWKAKRTTFVRVLFNGSILRDLTSVDFKKFNRLNVVTSQVSGRHASQLLLKIVPNKNIHVSKAPKIPPKDALKADGLVVQPDDTRRWSFPKLELPAKTGKTDSGEYTIQLWAVYNAPDGVEYRRFCCCVHGNSKKKK